MNIFQRLFGKPDDNCESQPPAMPWDRKPSILEFLRSHIVPNQAGLADEAHSLPDEKDNINGSQIRWAPGAMDGVATHHMGFGSDDDKVQQTVRLALAYSGQPTTANKAAIYRHIIEENMVSVIDAVIEGLLNEKGINHQRLYELAYSLATEAPDREPVKFGIAILGLFRNPDNVELFQTLGRHDEFTLFCAVAITNSDDDQESALWELGRNVDGWGRIHVVERLADTSDPDIKNWLLREGYRNSVMYEYLAAICARAGGLLLALSTESPDRELLTSAGEIIDALISGGPAESLDDYDDGRLVVEMYLNHMDRTAESISDFTHVNSIQRFLDEEDSQWESRMENGWTSELRMSLKRLCQSILGRPEWPARVREGLASQDGVLFARANQAARVLGIETWEIHWKRLQDEPIDYGRWYHVVKLCDEDRIGSVIELAERSLELQALSVGPGDALGLGPGFEKHSCLGVVLQELERFPMHGSALIDAGLKSPVIRNRNMAVRALSSWSFHQWPTGLHEALRKAAAIEPIEDVKDRMRELLNGEPMSS